MGAFVPAMLTFIPVGEADRTAKFSDETSADLLPLDSGLDYALYEIALLSPMMLPYAVTLIPTFIFWQKLGLIDTYYPLTIPAWFGGGAFNMFLLRQFFRSISRELDEAACLDGASPLRGAHDPCTPDHTHDCWYSDAWPPMNTINGSSPANSNGFRYP